MKAASTALADLLQSGGPYTYCELYTFTLLDGSIKRTCDVDVDVTWNSNLYPAGKPICERTALRTSVGIEVDSMTVTIFPNDSDLVSGMPFAQAAMFGGLDGCSIRVERAYLDELARQLRVPEGLKRELERQALVA